MFHWNFPLIPLGIVLLVLSRLSWGQPRALFALAQWSHTLGSIDEDADRFYARLFGLLEARLDARPLPFSSLSLGPRRLFATCTALGGDALYLEARYRHLTYYVYACPTPGGLFVSAWLFSSMAGWEEHPLLKWLLLWRAYQMTLFGADCVEIFHHTVHGALLDLLDDYARERGLPPLDAVARQPVLHGFYVRRRGVATMPGQMMPGQGASGTLPAFPSPAQLPFEVPEGRSVAAVLPPTASTFERANATQQAGGPLPGASAAASNGTINPGNTTNLDGRTP